MLVFWIIIYALMTSTVVWRMWKGNYKKYQSHNVSLLLVSFILFFGFTKLPIYIYILTFILNGALMIWVIRKWNTY